MKVEFSEMDLGTMALAVHTLAEIYRIQNVSKTAQMEMDRVDELLIPYRPEGMNY